MKLFGIGEIPPGEQDPHQAEIAPADYGHIPATLGQLYPFSRPIYRPFQVIELDQDLAPHCQYAAKDICLRHPVIVGKLRFLLNEFQNPTQPSLQLQGHSQFHRCDQPDVSVLGRFAHLHCLQANLIGLLKLT